MEFEALTGHVPEPVRAHDDRRHTRCSSPVLDLPLRASATFAPHGHRGGSDPSRPILAVYQPATRSTPRFGFDRVGPRATSTQRHSGCTTHGASSPTQSAFDEVEPALLDTRDPPVLSTWSPCRTTTRWTATSTTIRSGCRPRWNNRAPRQAGFVRGLSSHRRAPSAACSWHARGSPSPQWWCSTATTARGSGRPRRAQAQRRPAYARHADFCDLVATPIARPGSDLPCSARSISFRDAARPRQRPPPALLRAARALSRRRSRNGRRSA